MSGAPNKIIINRGRTDGNYSSISARYDVLRMLGDEVKEHGLLAESEPAKELLKKACDVHDKADKAFINAQDQVIAMLAEVIDKKVITA